ncbi:hypothetical protein [Nostoc sp. NMS9]|uniref:hypothetical protein n=1 Tax=Nostoc sp. NMS9 TaxID=2815393 RepID=UPI0025EE7592|nr:hypothetical protein [Nostoc sp. NMS9]MBN3941501.1 hypothetical protein [Nostoc sp. NMS9]
MKRVSKALHENVLGTGIFTQHSARAKRPATANSTQHGLNAPLPLTALKTQHY